MRGQGFYRVRAPWLVLGTGAALALMTSAPAGASRMLFIGDSITSGAGLEPGTAYPELVATAFPALEGVNAGCPGSATADWVRPGPTVGCGVAGAFDLLAAPNLPAEIATILLGTNDAVGFFEPGPVSPASYRSNLEHVIARLEPETQWILLMTPPARGPGNPAADALLSSYRDEVLDLCSAPSDSVVCGPDVQLLLDPALHFSDGIHPDAVGHALIADALVSDLRLLVPEPATAMLVLSALLALGGLRRRAGRR